jgi:hypothetical protein
MLVPDWFRHGHFLNAGNGLTGIPALLKIGYLRAGNLTPAL